jgi:hypothetical protein
MPAFLFGVPKGLLGTSKDSGIIESKPLNR